MSLTDKVFNAGVVGCGGAGFPTHVKFNAKVEHFIINAAECEPLLRTDRYLMVHKASEIIKAALAIKEQLCAVDCTIALKKTYTKEINALKKAINDNKAEITIHEMESFYPAGDEQVIAYEVVGKVVPSGGIPLDINCVVSNLATVYSVYNAMQGYPFIKKYLTVTGEVNNPTVICAPIGTSLNDCIELAGGALIDDFFVISGGPMMGKWITKEQAQETVVTKTTSGFIVISANSMPAMQNRIKIEHTLNRAKSACIQCTFCTELCPRFLLGHPIEPHRIMRKLAGSTDIEAMLDDETIRNAQLCCECGVCELYACPMQLQPRKVNMIIKELLEKQGVRPEKSKDELAPSAERKNRKIPTNRAATRAGVGDYYHIEIESMKKCKPSIVKIPLLQHIGSPSELVATIGQQVKQGDLIAKCPEGKLGANIHASIDGKITDIGMFIEIRGGE
ncbi:MAG TPA: 4Fe-4S dicluster domain-containing protein [Clostridia bacterium]|nr:4Fe-4S dicluster domain-containing protein [Clostridia bacterium]